jgi:hypothetical protein
MITENSFFKHESTAFAIVYIGGVNINRKQMSFNIGYDMSFSPFRFFPPSKPRSSLA